MTWNKIWQITNTTNKLTSHLEKEQVFADINKYTKMSMQKSRRKSITIECCSHPCAECCKELMMFGSEHNTNNLITSHSGTIRNLHPANNFPHSQRLFSYFHLDYPRSELWAPSEEENIFALLMCFCTWPPLDKVAEILYAMGKG